MKKSFQKTLIAAAVLVTAGTASANSLLFPYFTTAAGAQSVLSISANGSAATGTNINNSERLHYVYNYGAACTHFDTTGNVTGNDVLQHSVNNASFGGFGKVQAADGSNPGYLNVAGTYGFLTVTNRGTDGVNPTTGAAINGDMAIIDPASGLVVSYAGINNTGNTAEGDYSNIVDNAFELSYYPNNLVTTSFYAVVAGNMNAVINGTTGVANGGSTSGPARNAGSDWKAAAVVTNRGNVYNNDEVPYSGTVQKAIVCSGTFGPTDLQTTAQTNNIGTNAGLIRTSSFVTSGNAAVGNAAQQVTGATYDVGTGLVVVKLQKILPAAGMAVGTTLLHRVPVAN